MKWKILTENSWCNLLLENWGLLSENKNDTKVLCITQNTLKEIKTRKNSEVTWIDYKESIQHDPTNFELKDIENLKTSREILN